MESGAKIKIFNQQCRKMPIINAINYFSFIVDDSFFFNSSNYFSDRKTLKDRLYNYVIFIINKQYFLDIEIF